MIITGGVNVYPQEAENVLAMHPKVNDVAVFGVPNDDFGEEVKAVVQPAVDGRRRPRRSTRELIAYCKEHLADVKCPRSVDFRPELPRHPTGKLYKRLLKDEYWADAGRIDLDPDARQRRVPVPRLAGAPRLRPPRRGQRGAGEHDARLRARGRPRLPVPRDRRPRHRRRRAGGVPRRPTRPRHRPHRRRSPSCPWAEVRAARVDGREPIPLLEDLLGAWPDVRINIDPKHDARRRAAGRRRSLRTGTVDRVCVGAFSDKRIAKVKAPRRRRGCARRWVPREVARLVSASRRGPGAAGSLVACAPGSARNRAGSRSSTGASSTPPTASGCRCTCGRSTTAPRWRGCSTSASTGS